MNVSDVMQKIGSVLSPEISDIHLMTGVTLRIRQLGMIVSISDEPLSTEVMMALVNLWLTTDQITMFQERKDLDIRISLIDIGEFRAHIAYHQSGISIALRPLPIDMPTLSEVRLPAICEQLITERQGLILVTGATGSGKSTSLAAMVNHINKHHSKHIITLEDPIERRHISLQSLVQQREVGRDCISFADGLHAAMRQDPDVIMIGEIRDLASIRMALTASETGHLVLATLHASSASQAIDRIVDVFAADEKSMVQSLLSQTILAVLNQQLITVQLEGRIAIYELLVATPAIRNLIREGKTAQISSLIQTGQAHGMQTFERSNLRRL